MARDGLLFGGMFCFDFFKLEYNYYTMVLVSAVQQSESAISVYIYI